MPILLSHYRRHPIQALFLIAGITIANVLLVGTTLINAQARASYDQSSGPSGSVPQAFISAANGARYIDETDYFKLRRLGFDQLAPVLNWFARTESGQSVELTGIDIFAMPRNQGARNHTLSREPAKNDGRTSASDFISPPFQLWTAPSRLTQLNVAEGQRISLASNDLLPPLAAVEDRQLGHRMLIDIGALQSLSGLQGQLSGIFSTLR